MCPSGVLSATVPPALFAAVLRGAGAEPVWLGAAGDDAEAIAALVDGAHAELDR